MFGAFATSTTIAIVLLIIIIFLLYKRETHNLTVANKLVGLLAESQIVIDELNAGVCGQETDLGKCRGDLSTCDNKSMESEFEITTLTAEIQEAKEKLAVAEESLKLHKHLTFELKNAINNCPCGYGIVPQRTELTTRAEKLLTIIDDQSYLIQQLQRELIDRNARISQLTKRQFAWAGM